MKYILTIVFAAAICFNAFSQDEAGIYLTVQCAKKSQKQTVAISGKQVCIAAHPIILIDEFQAVTDLQESKDKVWFDLTLSNKAIQKLLQLSSSLPNSTFAFVVDQSVFSTFAANDLRIGKIFRFEGTDKYRSVLTDAQKDLKAAIDARTQ